MYPSVVWRWMFIPFHFYTLENSLLPIFTLYLQHKWPVSRWSILIHTNPPLVDYFVQLLCLPQWPRGGPCLPSPEQALCSYNWRTFWLSSEWWNPKCLEVLSTQQVSLMPAIGTLLDWVMSYWELRKTQTVTGFGDKMGSRLKSMPSLLVVQSLTSWPCCKGLILPR